MTANELADKLEQGHWEGGTREQAATMLRQQQVEIEALKAKTLTDDPLVNFKPVWQEAEKTLTDEEILKMAANTFHYSEYKLVIDFARAILRKAQEK